MRWKRVALDGAGASRNWTVLVNPSQHFSQVLDQLALALTKAVTVPDDAVVVLEPAADGQTRVLIGERGRMLPALVADGIVDTAAECFLRHAAPRGYVWAVICWDAELVSTILHPFERRDRGAS